MTTYIETEEDLPAIRAQIRHLASVRQHRISRQLGQLDSITLKAAQSIRSYLNRQPNRPGIVTAVREFEHRAWAAQERVAAATFTPAQLAEMACEDGDADPNSLHVENEIDQTPAVSAYAKAGGAPASDEPRDRRAPAAERLRGEEDHGYYRHGDDMYKVATSLYGASQGHLFARKLNKETGDWERAQGMTSYLRKSERVSLEQAVEFGRQLEITPQMALYGKCWICKRPLTNEQSIIDRVGPGPHIGIDA